MPSTVLHEREKQELETIWASGIFSRAPNLALLLKYICSKYFEGTAEEIKEYNIAVEALGRPPEFDQKRDSIVRVEAHRLRKRLREYYGNEGAGHEVQIEIPSGQYTPRFIFRAETGLAAINSAEPPAEQRPAGEEEQRSLTVIQSPIEIASLQPQSDSELNSPPTLPPPSTPASLPPTPAPRPPLARPPLARSVAWLAAILVLATGLGATYFALHSAPNPPARAARLPENPPAAGPPEEIRIMAGIDQGVYVDSFEHSWQSDRFFEGGSASPSTRTHPVLGARDQRLYQNRREGTFRYDIPLQPGPHQLHLYFAETMFGENNAAGGAESSRIFNISLNGKPLLQDFDVISDAGAGVADIRVFKNVEPATDGKLHLEFTPITNAPFVNAIEIVPGLPGHMKPLRIAARDSGVKDTQGRYWDPDRYTRSGQLVARPESNIRNADPEIFRGERFGNLNYIIPVASPGRYTVNLYFAENWFGPGMPGGGPGVGSRIFDVLLNGVVLRHKFDIFREAGGNDKAVIVTARGVEPNHQGKIVISMPPAVNYACINALEILDESR